jgi:hypothetical protein
MSILDMKTLDLTLSIAVVESSSRSVTDSYQLWRRKVDVPATIPLAIQRRTT